MTTVKVRFSWEMYRPDARQYKQQSIEVEPTVGESWDFPLVEIELPVNLLANAEEYLNEPLQGRKEPQPIFTVAAVKYLVDEWEKVFSDPKDVSPDDFKPTTEDEWDDETPKTNSQKVAEQMAEDENWDEAEKPESKDEQWDEKEEDWGSEPNLDN